MKTTAILCLTLLASAVPAALGADALTVQIGGEKVRGEVVRVTPKEVVLLVKGNERTYPAVLLEPPAYLACARKLLDPLDPKDAKALYELGEWCRAKGLGKEAAELIATAKKLDPSVVPQTEAPAAQQAVAKEEPKPAARLSAEELIAKLSHEEFAERQAAMEGLRAMSDKAQAALEKAAAGSQDTEQKSRVDRLLREITQGRAWTELTAEEKSIAELPFSAEEEQAGSLRMQMRGHDSYALMDVGNRLRLVLRDQPYNGSSTVTLSIGGGGMSSSQAGSLKVVSSGGKATCSFRTVKFVLTKDTLKIDGQTIARDDAQHVVFVNKDGKFEKAVVVPGSGKKDEEKAAEK